MATFPQLDIPSMMNKPGPWVIQPINTSSDGNPSQWRPPPYHAISNDGYRVKLGSLWAEEKGIATPGKTAHACVVSRFEPLLLSLRRAVHSVVLVHVSKLSVFTLFCI